MHEIDNPGWHMHRSMTNPMADLKQFIRGCSEDPVTRVMSVTALVLALCQAAGPAMMAQPAGFLLIRADDGETDPIDRLMWDMTGMSKPSERPAPEEFERNRRTMKAALAQMQDAGASGAIADFFGFSKNRNEQFTTTFHSAMRNNCGDGRVGWYANRRDPEFGWCTDGTGHTILRVDRSEVRLQFMEDIRLHPERLVNPACSDEQMTEQAKKLSLVGSLPVADWHPDLAEGVVGLALPVLFLPHAAEKALILPPHRAIEWLGIALAAEANGSLDRPVTAYDRLGQIMNGKVELCLSPLRERLRYFPSDYEFFVMRTLRELLMCCSRLVGIVAPAASTYEDLSRMIELLYDHVLHGVRLGVEALGWHGYGFACPGGPKPAQCVLEAIREHGSMSKRDLQRDQQWLTAESRDAILDVLVREGLIERFENQVRALPFGGYWRHVAHRCADGMPEFKKVTAQVPAA